MCWSCSFPQSVWPHTMYLENTWESRAFLWFWNYSRNNALEPAVAVHGPQPAPIMKRCHVLDESSSGDLRTTLCQVLPLGFSPLPERPVIFDSPPLLHMPSSLSPWRDGGISTHFCSKYSWGHGPAGPLPLHSTYLEVTSSGHKRDTPFLLLTSVLFLPTHQAACALNKKCNFVPQRISRMRSVPHL